MIRSIPPVFSASFVAGVYKSHAIAGTAQNRAALEIAHLEKQARGKNPAVEVTISNEAKALNAQMRANQMKD
jgi:hypothetical protein